MAQIYGAWADCSDQLKAVGEDMAIWNQKNTPTAK